jgi:hypothetical protein
VTGDAVLWDGEGVALADGQRGRAFSRQCAGDNPVARLKARLNEASDS